MALATRLETAELLTSVSQRFIDLAAGEVEKGVAGALRAVVEAFGFERAIVAQFAPDRTHFFISHRHPERLAKVAFEVGERVPNSKLPTTTKRVLAGAELIIGSDEELPESELRFYRELGFEHGAILPMSVSGHVTGAIGFAGKEPESIRDLHSLRLVAQLFASAFDRKRTDAVLVRRLAAAELIRDVSRRFVELPSAELDRGIEGALRAVVEAFDLSLGDLGEFRDDRRSFVVTHRYRRPDEPPIFEPNTPMSTELVPALNECVSAGREFLFDEPGEIPADASAERRIAERHGLSAVAVFPLLIGGEVFGFVGFRSKQPLTPAIDTLRVVAQLFASAMDRKRADAALQLRLKLAELIAEISRRLIELSATELDAAFNDTLKRVAELCDFKTAIVYRLSDDKQRFSITHRFVAHGIEPETPLGIEEPVATFSFVAQRLASTKAILLDASLLPPEATGEREALARRGGRYGILVPLVVGGETLGAVLFEGDPPLPAPQLVDATEVIAEFFAGAMDRYRQSVLLEERLRFEQTLSGISARIIATPESFDSIIEDALRATAEALEFDRVALFELTGGKGYFQLVYEWRALGIPSFAGSSSGLSIDEFGWPLTELRLGRAMVFGPHNIPPEGVNARLAMTRDGTRLTAFVPMIVAGEVTGCIGYFRVRVDRRLAPGQLRRLQLVGEMMASAIARKRALVSLENAEARFQKVVASALDGFVMINEAGVILEWTARSERMLGWQRGEMLGSALTNVVIHTKDATSGALTPASLYERAQQSADRRVEVQGKHRDGYDVPLELSISALDGPESKVFAMFVRDITDRKRAEQVRQQAFDEVSRLKLQAEGERDYLREELRAERRLGEFVGKSPRLAQVLELIESVAGTSATVLIRGESGVGKELVARAIHTRSRRAEGPLVKVNCASIPKELFESEFFGHVRGAFTGALRNRVGRFELADRGTLFLDEVGEIPLDLQAKLLRVLQESEFERVGDDRTRKVDVRVVAATNRDLEAEAAAGRFRKDLYYRLSVFPIEIPPLRERREDVVPLAEHFLAGFCRSLGRPALELSPAQHTKLEAYEWPGNVRELQHVMERAVILSPSPPLRLDLALPGEAAATALPAAGRVLTDGELRELERENLRSALERAKWQIAGPGGAAELLGLNPSTLRDRMRAYDLQRPKAG